MMIDKRLINTVEDSKKWIAINVLWNWVALIGGIISAVVFAICLQWAFERTHLRYKVRSFLPLFWLLVWRCALGRAKWR